MRIKRVILKIEKLLVGKYGLQAHAPEQCGHRQQRDQREVQQPQQEQGAEHGGDGDFLSPEGGMR